MGSPHLLSLPRWKLRFDNLPPVNPLGLRAEVHTQFEQLAGIGSPQALVVSGSGERGAGEAGLEVEGLGGLQPGGAPAPLAEPTCAAPRHHCPLSCHRQAQVPGVHGYSAMLGRERAHCRAADTPQSRVLLQPGWGPGIGVACPAGARTPRQSLESRSAPAE